ncbi:MAG: hypothetical protein IOB85_00470 [Methylobacterium sp.]|jgi:hypothetical protein|nr:hypothetical protein [Methylobacterium sp.]MCA3640789.1 hypothetical protein [Methylobacterium sp.]MCA3647249.1 hypothetical protein [Methylobacterium sp.]MCA3652461.1 hypothetical protein [Methylobacterium sp.]MCA3653901.1 hypothetical protein [Methylobacterium sp.]
MTDDRLPRNERPVRDLPDFVLRWQEFRPTALGLLERPVLDTEERQVVNWLILMADKITGNDVRG